MNSQFLGHGMCEAYNKQAPLIAQGGRATSDDKDIGEHAWRLLKSFNFDPKELRGISIQIQKLEKTPGPQDAELGQALLPFKRVDTVKPPRTEGASTSPNELPRIAVQPASQDDDIQIIDPPAKSASPQAEFDLPSFSQVDMSVFEALPEDVRKELEDEYKRRSVTPGPVPGPKEPTPAPEPGPSVRRYNFSARGVNVKRITRQLAPRSRPMLSQTNKLFAKRVYASSIAVSDRELRRYGIDPSVFAALPPELQREQLAARRKPGVTLHLGARKPLKPSNKPKNRRGGGFIVPRPPPPKAVFLAPPTLKQRGEKKGEQPLCFSEKEDVQRVVETWVEGFREHPPNQRDVDYFAKFLVQSVDGACSSDTGIERAIAVAKWWLVLLKRHFGVWEEVGREWVEAEMPPRPARMTSEYVGRAWWRAFWEVKGKMDVVARKKFGGCLSLK